MGQIAGNLRGGLPILCPCFCAWAILEYGKGKWFPPLALGATTHMPLRTDINPAYLIRLGVVGLLCTGMCLYCVYDGTITYPNQQLHFDQYEEFAKGNADLDELDRETKWNEVAVTTHGWLVKHFKDKKGHLQRRTTYHIRQQFAMATLTGLLGFIFLLKLIGHWRCWIEATEDELSSSEGRKIAFDQIGALDKKLWRNKGIAKVLYEQDGRKKKIVLDDCNYVRNTTHAILRHLEGNIDHAKIINGKPEPPSAPKASLASDAADNQETTSAQATGETTS